MRDWEKEIGELRERTARNRIQFLRAELETSTIALDRARYLLAQGNRHEAQKEWEAAAEGLRVIERFLPATGGRDEGIGEQAQRLREALKGFAKELEAGREG